MKDQPLRGAGGGYYRALKGAPEAPGSGKMGSPERGSSLQFFGHPEFALGCSPGCVGQRNLREAFIWSDDAQQVSGAQILGENSERPAVSDGVVYRQNDHVSIRAQPEHFGPVERSAY